MYNLEDLNFLAEMINFNYKVEFSRTMAVLINDSHKQKNMKGGNINDM